MPCSKFKIARAARLKKIVQFNETDDRFLNSDLRVCSFLSETTKVVFLKVTRLMAGRVSCNLQENFEFIYLFVLAEVKSSRHPGPVITADPIATSHRKWALAPKQ